MVTGELQKYIDNNATKMDSDAVRSAFMRNPALARHVMNWISLCTWIERDGLSRAPYVHQAYRWYMPAYVRELRREFRLRFVEDSDARLSRVLKASGGSISDIYG